MIKVEKLLIVWIEIVVKLLKLFRFEQKVFAGEVVKYLLKKKNWIYLQLSKVDLTSYLHSLNDFDL